MERELIVAYQTGRLPQIERKYKLRRSIQCSTLNSPSVDAYSSKLATFPNYSTTPWLESWHTRPREPQTMPSSRPQGNRCRLPEISYHLSVVWQRTEPDGLNMPQLYGTRDVEVPRFRVMFEISLAAESAWKPNSTSWVWIISLPVYIRSTIASMDELGLHQIACWLTLSGS